MSRRKPSYANSEIAFNGGKVPYRRTTCRRDGRPVSFLIPGVTPSFSSFLISRNFQTAEIISLLYEATQGPQLPLQAPVLNPTGGVKVKQPVMLDFKQDPSRPGGGIFVAQGKMQELNDVSKGLVVSQLDEENGNSEGENAAYNVAASSVSLFDANDDNNRARADSSSAATSISKPSRKRVLPPDAFEQSIFLSSPNVVPLDILMTQSSSLSPPVIGSTNSFVKLTPLGAPSTNVKMNVNPAMNVQPEFSSGNIQVMNVLDSAASGSNLADFQMADNGFLEGLPGSMFDWGLFRFLRHWLWC